MDEKIIKNLPAVLTTIEKIKKDCSDMEKQGNLTEHGKGQLSLINIILKELELD